MQLNIELRINFRRNEEDRTEKFQIEDYTRLEKEETLIENEIVFFVNQLIFGVKLLRVRTVEIRNFTRIRQKILR